MSHNLLRFRMKVLLMIRNKNKADKKGIVDAKYLDDRKKRI
jgi:hypothetical protein